MTFTMIDERLEQQYMEYIEALLCGLVVEPLEAQRRLAHYHLERARLALGLPAHVSIAIEWRAPARGVSAPHGVCLRPGPNTYTITFNANQWPDELARVAYHEMQHVFDDRAGLVAGVNVSRDAFEARADRFAARMLGGEGAADTPGTRTNEPRR